MRSVWTTHCDEILLDALFDERRNGRQTDNGGWHTSAWVTAQSKLATSVSQSGGAPKSSSSCQTRWNTLKKDYKEVKAIRDLSGAGWDEEGHLVVLSDDVWEKYIQAHPKQKKWRKTAFPLFAEMADLVEGTYATGKGVFRPGQPAEVTDKTDLSDSDQEHDDTSANDISTPTHTSAKSGAIGASSSPLPDVLSTANKRRGHRKSGSHAINGVASSISRLAEAFTSDAIVPSPARKRAAIHMIKDDDQLTSTEQLKVYKLIRTDTSFADMIVSIRNQEARTAFIKDEIYGDVDV